MNHTKYVGSARHKETLIKCIRELTLILQTFGKIYLRNPNPKTKEYIEYVREFRETLKKQYENCK